MSYKIYYGSRCELQHINNAVLFYKKYFESSWRSYCLENLPTLNKCDIDHIGEFLNYKFKNNDEAIYYAKICNLLYILYISSKHDTILNPDYGLNFFVFDNYAYICPYGINMPNQSIFPDYLKEYMFFNNQDKPDSFSDEEWEDRFKNWEGATRNFRFNVEMFTFKNLDASGKIWNPKIMSFFDSVDILFDANKSLWSPLNQIFINFIEYQEMIKSFRNLKI